MKKTAFNIVIFIIAAVLVILPRPGNAQTPAAEGTVYLPLVLNTSIPAHLTLIKTVINDSGGTKVVSDFPLYINGIPAVSGVTYDLPAGQYTASEDSSSGYTASAWGGACSASGTVTLTAGQSAICTITNNDKPAHLGLHKFVQNNSGGTAQPTNFTLTASGPVMISGPGNVSGDVKAGTYTLSESGPAGYTAGGWSCQGGVQVGNQITLAPGESADCSIINDDIVTVPAFCNGNFESGTSCWTIHSNYGSPVITNNVIIPRHSGSWLAWLGGTDDEERGIIQAVTVPTGAPYLAYWRWIYSNDACGNDIGGVGVNSTVLDSFSPCTSTTTNAWVKRVLDLRSYSGQSVALSFILANNSSLPSQVFIDDVAWQASLASESTSPWDAFPDILDLPGTLLYGQPE